MEIENSHYALIKIDKTNLLLPQQEISIIEVISTVAIHSGINQTNAIGQYNDDEGEWPVFSFSSSFNKRNEITHNDKFCVCLLHPHYGQFGIVCNHVSSFNVNPDNVIRSSLQNMMMLSINPVVQLIYYQKYLYLVSNVNKLYQFLVHQHEK